MALLKASSSSDGWWAPSPVVSNELSLTNSDVNWAHTGQFAIKRNSLAPLLTGIFISLTDLAKGSAPKISNSKTFKCLSLLKHCSSGPSFNHWLREALEVQPQDARLPHWRDDDRQNLGKGFSRKEDLACCVPPSLVTEDVTSAEEPFSFTIVASRFVLLVSPTLRSQCQQGTQSPGGVLLLWDISLPIQKRRSKLCSYTNNKWLWIKDYPWHFPDWPLQNFGIPSSYYIPFFEIIEFY